MKKREATFSVLFRHWIRANKQTSAPYEMKQTTTDSLPFRELKEAQVMWLQAAKSDEGVLIRVIGHGGEPDYAYYRNSPAWVVVKYPDRFCVIDIDIFVTFRDTIFRKSLTADHAQGIAALTVKV